MVGRRDETLCTRLVEPWKMREQKRLMEVNLAIRTFVFMFLVFYFVFKSGEDPGMLMKRREESSRRGNLEIFKRVKLRGEHGFKLQMGR